MYLGKITVITGPMASGKTERILEITRQATALGIPVELFKPATDTRDASVKSRNGAQEACHHLAPQDSDTLHQQLEKGGYGRRSALIVIDEFQFLEDPTYIRDLNRLAVAGHGIVVSGLDMTSELMPFGLMPSIMCYADDVIKLKGRCEECETETPSLFTYADFEKIDKVAIEGETHKYKAVCRKCHLKHK